MSSLHRESTDSLYNVLVVTIALQSTALNTVYYYSLLSVPEDVQVVCDTDQFTVLVFWMVLGWMTTDV